MTTQQSKNASFFNKFLRGYFQRRLPHVLMLHHSKGMSRSRPNAIVRFRHKVKDILVCLKSRSTD